MKKMMILCLLVIGLFLVGCAEEMSDDIEELTAEELAELPEDLQPQEESSALAGQAVNWGSCEDPDAISTFDKTQLLTKSTTTYASGSKIDRCYTWYAGTPKEKTRLIEGACKNGKFIYYYYTCSDMKYANPGSDYQCVEGACVDLNVEEFVCEDSDGGENIYVVGEASDLNGGSFDACTFLNNTNGLLRESVCVNNIPTHVEIICPEETPYCNMAVCSSEEPICTDTDGGSDQYIQGTITEPRLEDGPQYTDYCQNMETFQPTDPCSGPLCGVREFYCQNPYVTTTYNNIPCPSGCANGACVGEFNYECTDSDDGNNYFLKGNTSGQLPAPEPFFGSMEDQCITFDENGTVTLTFDPEDCSGENCGVQEYYCDYSETYNTEFVAVESVLCDSGVCQDGACVEE